MVPSNPGKALDVVHQGNEPGPLGLGRQEQPVVVQRDVGIEARDAATVCGQQVEGYGDDGRGPRLAGRDGEGVVVGPRVKNMLVADGPAGDAARGGGFGREQEDVRVGNARGESNGRRGLAQPNAQPVEAYAGEPRVECLADRVAKTENVGACRELDGLESVGFRISEGGDVRAA